MLCKPYLSVPSTHHGKWKLSKKKKHKSMCVLGCVDDQHPRFLIHRSLHSWSDPCACFPYLILLKHKESYSHAIQHKQCMLAVMWQSPGQSWDVTKSWAVLGSYIIHFIKSGSRRDNCNSLSCWYIVHWVHLQTLGSSYADLRKHLQWHRMANIQLC